MLLLGGIPPMLLLEYRASVPPRTTPRATRVDFRHDTISRLEVAVSLDLSRGIKKSRTRLIDSSVFGFSVSAGTGYSKNRSAEVWQTQVTEFRKSLNWSVLVGYLHLVR